LHFENLNFSIFVFSEREMSMTALMSLVVFITDFLPTSSVDILKLMQN